MIAQSCMDISLASPLLGGLSPHNFMRRHWQKKPLLIRAAKPSGTANAESGNVWRATLVISVTTSRPAIVVTQHWDQRHPDHAMASHLVYDACFMAGLRNYRPDLGDAFRPRKVIFATSMTEAIEAAPTFVVDITKTFELKMRAIRAFASQFAPAPGETVSLPFDRFQQSVELTARRHGQRIGVTFGEGFVTREPVEVTDLVALSGRSI